MKKVISLITAVAAVLTLFSACEKNVEREAPITVNGTPVDSEIFMYYLDEAMTKAQEKSREARIDYATTRCIRYVATNSTFAEKNLELTPGESATVSSEGNSLWELFREHYESLGISKQTFMKIRTNAAYTERLRLALFDSQGETPIPDDVLKEHFSANYVAFKLVRGYLFTTDVYGNPKEYTNEELQKIVERYNKAAGQINQGASIEAVYPTLISGDQEVEQALKTVVITEGDPYYPEGFFQEVSQIQPDKAKVQVFGEYLYLVYRVKILDDGDLFKEYRPVCLKAVSEIPLQNEISKMCNSYTSVRRADIVDKCYARLRSG